MHVHYSGTPKSFGHALEYSEEVTHYINKCIVAVYYQVVEVRKSSKFNSSCDITPLARDASYILDAFVQVNIMKFVYQPLVTKVNRGI